MARYQIEDYEETDEKSQIKADVFTVTVAILLYISFGILLTIGSFLWVRSELRDFFDISYAGYGMLLIVVISVSELWALFIEIPSINGYDEIVPLWVNNLRLFVGAIILVMFTILSIVFFASPQNGGFRLFLAKRVYSINGHLQNNFVERLAMIDEVIDRGGANAEQFAERGKIYLEIAKIKADGTEEYKYSLPDNTFEECYEIAINNFDDAIAQDDEVAEYYYLRGKAKYYDTISYYSAAKDDFEKAIELDDAVSDYYFYCARACYEIGTDSTDSDEEIQSALNYINSAIKKYTEEESDSDEDSESESTSDAEVDTDDVLADELDSVNQDKILAEYYYYAGLINIFIEDNGSLEKAIENYRKAIIYDSGNAEYFSELGIAYYTSGDLTEAERAFDRAISIDKADLNYSNEGYHLAWKAHVIEDERIDEAIEIYEESLKFRADYAYSYRRLAELYEANDDDDVKVKNVYNRAIKHCTDNAEFYYASGIMHYDEGEFNHTIEDMKKAMEGDSSYTADAYYYIGCSYHLLENYREAYKYYQRAKDNGSERSNEIDKYMNDCLEYVEE